MASPTFTINGSAITTSVQIAAGAAVTALVSNVDGVRSCSWTILRTDDTGTPGDAGTYGAPALSGAVNQQAVWTASTAGTAATIQVTINGGMDEYGNPSTAMTATGKFWVVTSGGREVCVAGEQEDDNRESSSTHGLIRPLNEMIRAYGSDLGDWKASARLVTAAALPAYTRVGSTITANANGAMPNVDSVAVALNDRLLLEATGTASDVDNGLWDVDDLGTAGTPWVLTRSIDADQTGELTSGCRVAIEEGTVYAGHVFALTSANPIVINTDTQTWVDAGSINLFNAAAAGTVNTGGAVADVFLQSDGTTSGGTWVADPRLANTAALLAKDNAGNDANVATLSAADVLTFGDTTHVQSAVYDSVLGHSWDAAGTPVLSCTASLISAAQDVTLADAKTLQFGTTAVATAGDINTPDVFKISGRNTGDTVDCDLMFWLNDMLYVGHQTNVADLFLYSNTGVTLHAAGDIAYALPTEFIINDGITLRVGWADAATTGQVRYQNTTTSYARDFADANNALIWGFDASDNLTWGDPAHVDNCIYDALTSHSIDIAGTPVLTIAASLITAAQDVTLADGKGITLGTTNPATGYDVNFRTAFSVGARNNANGANLGILSATAADEIYVGDGTNTVGMRFYANTAHSWWIGATKRMQVSSSDIALMPTGTAVLTCTASLITAAQDVQTADGKTFNCGTTNCATTGTAMNWRSGATISVYNAAGDFTVLQGDTHVTLGGNVASMGDLYLAGNSSSTMYIRLGGANQLSVTTSLLTAAQPVKLQISGTSRVETNATGLGFFAATPVAQPNGTGETVGFTAGSGTGVNDDSTFTGNVGGTAYRISDVVKALKNVGLMAA